jgi:hypothetical protein
VRGDFEFLVSSFKSKGNYPTLATEARMGHPAAANSKVDVNLSTFILNLNLLSK